MLKVYTLEQPEQWDAVVRSFRQHDVYQLSGYVDGFRIHGDGTPLLLHYEDETLRGINVVMRRDVAYDPHFVGRLEENRYFDLATPYGYGGWILEGCGKTEKLVEECEDWCLAHGVAAEFVRLHPILEEQSELLAKLYDVVPMGPTIAMDLSSKEMVWANLTSKNRNMIRKAQKSGLTVCRAQCPEIYEVFRELYDQTMDRDNADQYYYFAPQFYTSILEKLTNQSQVFYARTADGTIAAAAIMLTENGRMNYHLSASRRELQHLAPTNLLLYEAAVWGAENGFQTLHLGGGVGSREDSLYSFKKAFYRGNPMRYHIGKKIWNSEAYEMLTNMRQDAPENGFFPAYRR